MSFLEVLVEVLKLFIIVIFGYVIGKKGLITKDGQKQISSVLLYIAMPCAIIRGMQIPFSMDRFSVGVSIILIMAVTYFLTVCLSFVLIRFLPCEGKEKDVFQASMILPNVGYMGFTMIGQLLGEDKVFFATLASLSFEFMAWSVGMYLVARNGDIDMKHNVIKKSIVNPGVLSVLAGFTLFLLQISIPEPLKGAVNSTGAMMSPLAMIIIGISLSRAKISEFIFNYKIYLVSLCKLILLPMAMFVLYSLIGLKDIQITVPIILIAMPTASYVTIFATNVGSDDVLASQVASVCTILSMITIPFVVGFLKIGA